MERFLTGVRVTLDTIKNLAQTHRLKLFPDEKVPFFTNQKIPEKCYLVAGELDEKTLEKYSKLPFFGIIDSAAQAESVEDFLNHLPTSKHSFSLLCTSSLIYRADIAEVFVETLRENLNLTPEKTLDIRMALHETLINALVHGNLEICTGYAQTAYDFMNYMNLLQRRLKSEEFSQKSVSVYAVWDTHKLIIKVKDEGSGYTHKRKPIHANPKKRTSGRGLIFIAGLADSCTLSDAGREVTLVFDLKDSFCAPYLSSEEENIQQQIKTLPSLSTSRILIVNRNFSDQMMLSRLLNMLGITEIEIAATGTDGLQKVKEFKPDLIILDIALPQAGAYDMLYTLRSDSQTKNLPVLIETANDTREARDKTFKMKATDFITKPLNPLEFFSRIKVHLENALLVRHLQTQLSQIHKDLSMAKEMQHSLIPSDSYLRNINTQYHTQIASYFAPTVEIGGDFWDIIPLTPERVAFYICDFSGHGISAALNTFRLHALITQTDRNILSDPARTVATLNMQMNELLPRGQFATFLYAVLDIKSNLLTYTSAGAPRPFLCMPDGKILRLKSSGMPLGIKKDISYDNLEVLFLKESTLFLYSDALLDAVNKEGFQLSEKGFFDIVSQNFKSDDTEKIMSGIMKDFYAYAPPPPADDLTAVLIKRRK